MGNQSGDESGEDRNTEAQGLGPSRLAQLRRDLALTPEERVRAAEGTLKLDRIRHAGAARQVIGFDRYEDYLDYKWKQSTGGG